MSALPRGWVEAILDELVTANGLVTDGDWVESKDQDPNGEVRLTQLADVGEGEFRNRSNRYMTLQRAEELGCTFLQAGDVLIARMPDPLGRACIFPGLSQPAVTVVDVLVFRSGTDLVSPQWIMSAINATETRQKIIAQASGTTRQRISGGNLKRLPLPFPPLAEQKRIVAKLDALNAKSARARTELARIETLVSRYKQAVLSKAFSGELTAHARKPSGETIQATISDPFTHTQSAPAYWTRHLFSEVCTIVGGSQPPKTTFTYAPQEGYVRLVQIRDYKSDAKATYIPRDLARRFCTSTDIMIGRYGPPIFQILRGIEGAYNVALMKAEPTEAVAQEFLYWYLHHPVLFKYIEIDSKRTAGQDGVNKAHLERWPILLPPLEEQHEIVRRIESAFARIDRLAAQAKRALELVGKLDEAILAKAFRGELVPQDENDEPADRLLARLRAAREAAPKAKRGRRATA